MRLNICTLFAVSVCACVLIMFVAPGIDLPQTALRAYHSALLVISSFLFAAFALSVHLLGPEAVREFVVEWISGHSEAHALAVSFSVLRC